MHKPPLPLALRAVVEEALQLAEYVLHLRVEGADRVPMVGDLLLVGANDVALLAHRVLHNATHGRTDG